MKILLPLILTLLIETVIYVFLKPKSLKLLATVIGLNLILNPAMNLILGTINNPFTFNRVLYLSEVLTIIIETAVIFLIVKTPFKKTLIFAILSNVGSFLCGLIFFYPNSMVTSGAERLAFTLMVMLFTIIVLVVILFSVSASPHKDDDSTN